jgi:hypothetical protein
MKKGRVLISFDYALKPRSRGFVIRACKISTPALIRAC